jgi:protein-tyrosine phosphatase
LPLIDTHSHILPGIDDGSKTLEESLELCRMAAEDGVRTTVCTPHIDFKYANTRQTIEAAFRTLEGALQAEGIALRLVRGAEVHMSPDILPRLKANDLLTYNDKARHMLLEFPFQAVIPGVDDMVYRLRLAGITPVVAHPERIAYFTDNVDRLATLVRLGALAQITGGSVLGQFGQKSQQAALTMIRRNLAHVVASDAHDPSYRRPVLSEAAAELERLFGAARARSLVVETPSALVEGGDVEPPEPVEEPARMKGFLSSWFSRRSST